MNEEYKDIEIGIKFWQSTFENASNEQYRNMAMENLDILIARLKEIETKDGLGMAIGSRAHMVKSDSVVKVPFSFYSLILQLHYC